MLHRLRSSIQFIRDLRGTAAIEFAFVAPVLFTLTIGTIDVGRMVWSHSMLNHMAREATRYASVRGAESNNTVSKADMQTYVANRLIGVDPGEVNVTVTWTPSNSSGGTIFIQLDYQYNFLIGGLVGLDPIALQGDSAMVVL
jgi:Flp pilus assembly protein TadG